MKITQLDNGSIDIKISTKENQVLLSIFIHGLIGTGELKLNAETKEFEPTEQLKELFEKVQPLENTTH